MSPSEEQYELLLQRLKDRIEDGRGETIYDIGIGEGLFVKCHLPSINILKLVLYIRYMCLFF